MTTNNFSPLSPLVRASSVLLLAALTSLSAQAQQKLIPAQSEVGFAIKQMGVPVDGHFKKFDAQIALNPAKPESGKIAFTIDIASATMGSPEADAELPKATWFNSAKFPQATFQSTSIKGLGGAHGQCGQGGSGSGSESTERMAHGSRVPVKG